MARKRGTSRTAARKKKRPSSVKFLGVLFWLVFFIVIISLFVINREKIRQTLAGSEVYERIVNRDPGAGESPQPAEGEGSSPGEIIIEVLPPPGAPIRIPDPPAPGAQTGTRAQDTPPPVQEPRTPSEPASGGQAPPQQTTPAPGQGTPAGESRPPEPPALRERSLYLIRIDSEGGVYLVKANRQLPVSDSPLVDVLNSLLSGPTREEQNQSLVSLIPRGSRILPGQTTVRGSTAYISLSEEFQYNTYGVEGHTASLRQIIWTVTEFPNVDDVQILIEGRRIDYLGEGLWIGSPINRGF